MSVLKNSGAIAKVPLLEAAQDIAFYRVPAQASQKTTELSVC